MLNNKKQVGFTLIEVLITVAIIGIIAAIALPSYEASVRKANRSDGIALLNRIMESQERHFVDNYTYATDLTVLGYASANNLPSDKGFYAVTAIACAGGTITDCVQLTATPQGSQAQPGEQAIVLDSTGGRGTAAQQAMW